MQELIDIRISYSYHLLSSSFNFLLFSYSTEACSNIVAMFITLIAILLKRWNAGMICAVLSLYFIFHNFYVSVIPVLLFFFKLRSRFAAIISLKITNAVFSILYIKSKSIFPISYFWFFLVLIFYDLILLHFVSYV